MPWRYVAAIGREDGDGQPVIMTGQGVAAYGIDLLERRMPGITKQLHMGASNPHARSVARDRINSLTKPGEQPLYERLCDLEGSGSMSVRGTMMIMRALGIENETVRDTYTFGRRAPVL